MTNIELDPKTADIAEMLSGRTYPEDTVDVYMDEAAAYKLTILNRELERAIGLAATERAQEIDKQSAELKESVKGSKYVYTIRGISRELQRDILKAKMAELEATPEEERTQRQMLEVQEGINEATWAAMVVKIETPDGKVLAGFTPEEISKIINGIPDVGAEAVSQAIDNMRSVVAAGFDIAMSDIDFSSAA